MMAVQYPRLAYPENAAAISAMPREDRARYGWFVSYLLYTCEQILGELPTAIRSGSGLVRSRLGYHASYVCATVLKDDNRQLRSAVASAHP